MTRILDKLEAENLVWRDSHAEDGRRVDVVLSSRGAALAEESFRALLAAETELLAAFGKRRREEVVGMLDGLLAAFEARER
jgi:DNA-binding MarR family transcriptional regulator